MQTLANFCRLPENEAEILEDASVSSHPLLNWRQDKSGFSAPL